MAVIARAGKLERACGVHQLLTDLSEDHMGAATRPSATGMDYRVIRNL